MSVFNQIEWMQLSQCEQPRLMAIENAKQLQQVLSIERRRQELSKNNTINELEWKELDINNLPSDILVGNYEFRYKDDKEECNEDPYEILGDVMYRDFGPVEYRLYETKKEIISEPPSFWDSFEQVAPIFNEIIKDVVAEVIKRKDEI